MASFPSFAQKPFQNISFNEALKKSQREGKLIFVQYEAADCIHCNEVADKSFENEELAEQLSNTFVCLRISPAHKDREIIGTLYNITSRMGSLFIDQNKTLIHSYRMTTTRASEYVNQIDIALTKAGESSRVSELSKEYESGNRTIGFMELYLQKRATLHLATDELLDEYAGLLPEDSAHSVRTMNFIAQMSPVLESKADKILRKDQAIFSRAWYAMPNQKRASINTIIIAKSKKKAIEEKDEAYALRVAAFARSTHTGNYEAGARSYEVNMLDFYEEIKDTAKYFVKAIGYYDRYYMSVSVDSIMRKDSLSRARLFANAPASGPVIKGDKMVMTKAVAFSPSTQSFSADLNKGAWNFYLMTSNPYLLSVATEWIKKGLEFYKTPAALDTYSRLLYKQGQKQAAIEAQQMAIEQRKKQGFPTKEYEIVLEKMKKSRSLID
jgi:hypothetical protein